MADNITLYVKSDRVPIVRHSESISGHPCTGAYRTDQIIYSFNQQDRESMDILEEAGITYRLVDLSDCSFMDQLKAKLKGINETPTLVLDDEKIKGPKNIRQVTKEIKK